MWSMTNHVRLSNFVKVQRTDYVTVLFLGVEDMQEVWRLKMRSMTDKWINRRENKKQWHIGSECSSMNSVGNIERIVVWCLHCICKQMHVGPRHHEERCKKEESMKHAKLSAHSSE